VVSGDIGGEYEKEFLAADRFPGSSHTDNLYRVWKKFFRLGANDSFFSRSTDHGTNWSQPIQLSVPIVEGFSSPSSVATGSQGDFYAAWHSHPRFFHGGPFWPLFPSLDPRVQGSSP
jgi:hypothetical protein